MVRISRGLAERGIAVLRYDMTGLGGSGGDFSQTSFTTNLNDLNTAIEFAHSELGSVTALMGHSFGGAASLAAAGNPASTMSKPKALVTLAAPSDTHHLAKLLDSMNPAIQTDGIGDVNIGGYTWTIRDTMTADFRSHDLPAIIAKVDIPTLVFQSPTDTTVRYDHALRIASLVKENASIFTLHGADHLLSAAEDIDVVVETTAAFLHRYASRVS